MATGGCRIYSHSQQSFCFREASMFLSKKGFHLIRPDTGVIIALDDEGDSYEISYELACQKVEGAEPFAVELWLDSESTMPWTLCLEDNVSIQDFHFFSLDNMQIELASKTLFEFFLIERTKQNMLGIYIDKFGHTTEDIDWDEFFVEENVTLKDLPDTVCVLQDKLKNIKADTSHHVLTMIDNYALITSDLEILSCI